MMATFLFAVFPYLAVVLAVGVGLYRFRRSRYTYSSLSSQLLENRMLVWGSVPWHYGITVILLAHGLAWLFPRWAARILGQGMRLWVWEGVGLGLALFATIGLLILVVRRLPAGSRARAVTSPMDWLVLFVLLAQTLTGVGLAVFYRWGSRWFLDVAVPWLWSLVTLRPDVSWVASLPGWIQFHFVLGFVVILLIPFSRLVHLLLPPIAYLWRPYQVVVWYRDPRPQRQEEFAERWANTKRASADVPPMRER